MTIDDVLPVWDWRGAHATPVAVPPDGAAAAVRAFSGITRREMLAAIRRRAEA